MAQVSQVVHDKVDLHVCLCGAIPSLYYGGFGIVYADYVKAVLCEVDGV
jgi:hypothetical protein